MRFQPMSENSYQNLAYAEQPHPLQQRRYRFDLGGAAGEGGQRNGRRPEFRDPAGRCLGGRCF